MVELVTYYRVTGRPTKGDDTIQAGDAWDIIVGWLGDDTLSGGGGRDFFIEGNGVWGGDSTGDILRDEFYSFGEGSDVIDGGAGRDYISYLGRETGIVIDLARDRITSVNEEDTVRSVEIVEATEVADRVKSVDAGTDVYLLGGDDIVRLVSSDTKYVGGDGYDTIHLETVRGHTPTEVKYTGFERIFGMRNEENFLVGQRHDNVFVGGAEEDKLFGNNGADTLRGLDGRDTLGGGKGDDRLSGGAENDTIGGDEGDDTLLGGAGNDRIDGDKDDDLVLGGTGNDRIDGGSGRDDLRGGAGADKLFGGDAGDRIYGNAGDDFIYDRWDITHAYGGAGHDTIEIARGRAYGGAGADTFYITHYEAVCYGGQGVDTYHIDAHGRTRVFDAKGANKVNFEGAVRIELGSGDDLVRQTSSFGLNKITISTGSGDDAVNVSEKFALIDSGRGNDTLKLGRGAEGTVRTGAGEDTILLTYGHNYRVTLRLEDFNPNKDSIDLFGLQSFDGLELVETDRAVRVTYIPDDRDGHEDMVVFEGLRLDDMTDDFLI